MCVIPWDGVCHPFIEVTCGDFADLGSSTSILAAAARPVEDEDFNPDLARFVEDMAQTMYAAPGVGLAAPQVGDGRRILVANLAGDVDEDSRRDQLVIMINPIIKERSKDMIRWEGRASAFLSTISTSIARSVFTSSGATLRATRRAGGSRSFRPWSCSMRWITSTA